MKKTQEQEDKKLIENWPRQLILSAQEEGAEGHNSLWKDKTISFVHLLLAAQSRVSYREGVEAAIKAIT